MTDMHVGDVVVNVSDRGIFGEIVQATEAAGGLHSPTALDLWGTAGPQFSDSGLVPVRWYTEDGVPYEWWEAPEFLEVVRTRSTAIRPAVH